MPPLPTIGGRHNLSPVNILRTGESNLCPTPGMHYAAPVMQHNRCQSTPGHGPPEEPGRAQTELTELDRVARKNEASPAGRDTLLKTKDRTIAELKEQVASLRREVARKDYVLLRVAESVSELLSSPASGAPDDTKPVTPGGARDDDRARDARGEQDKPKLPNGYRLVAIASDAWVLVAPRGLRVAGYRGELDLRRAASDAREHFAS